MHEATKIFEKGNHEHEVTSFSFLFILLLEMLLIGDL